MTTQAKPDIDYDTGPLRNFAAQLRGFREAQGLSLADVAGRVGMPKSAVHKIEIGVNLNPTYGTLARLSAAVGGVFVIGMGVPPSLIEAVKNHRDAETKKPAAKKPRKRKAV